MDVNVNVNVNVDAATSTRESSYDTNTNANANPNWAKSHKLSDHHEWNTVYMHEFECGPFLLAGLLRLTESKSTVANLNPT